LDKQTIASQKAKLEEETAKKGSKESSNTEEINGAIESQKRRRERDRTLERLMKTNSILTGRDRCRRNTQRRHFSLVFVVSFAFAQAKDLDSD